MHFSRAILAAMTAVLLAPSPPAASAEEAGAACRLFVLREADGRVGIEAVPVPDGAAVELSGDDIITFILPLGPGQSGDVVQRDKGKATTIARCEGGALNVRVRLGDGRERAFPPVSPSELAGYDVRVSVIGGDGSRHVFMIRGYAEVETGDGPAVDMFGGVVPLGPDDYAVTSEVSRHRPAPSATGEAPLHFRKDLLLAAGSVAGRAGTFIVDFGAGGTVVSRSTLPAGTPIEKVSAIEYTADGPRELGAVMGGAGGAVRGFIGDAALDELRIGGIAFRDVTVHVIEEMPDFGGLDVAGILGLDLLRRGGVATFGYKAGSKLTMGPGAANAARADESIELPFRMVAKHIFFDGSIDGEAAHVILDTGARASILSRRLADRAGVRLSVGIEREFKGLDGKIIPATLASVRDFVLEGTSLGAARFYAADLDVFTAFGLGESGVLLGNDLLRQFSAIRVDFERERVALFR